MSEYSMPSYFQNMPVIGKELGTFHEDNAAEIQAVEQEIHEIREEIDPGQAFIKVPKD